MRQAPQELEIHQPRMLFRHLSVVEGDQRRDATDAVSRGNRRFLVDGDLGKAGARFELLSGAPS